jgi:hypothetical protein
MNITYNSPITELFIAMSNDDETSAEALHVLTVNVAMHCEYGTEGLGDWLAAGTYEGDETFASIAAEWDAYNEQA